MSARGLAGSSPRRLLKRAPSPTAARTGTLLATFYDSDGNPWMLAQVLQAT